jgi:DNA-binding NarL/FixJ family response regulator
MDQISILLVDDNPSFLNIAKRFLQGYDDIVVVDALCGGEDALEKAQGLNPDIVLIDLYMPSLPGLTIIPLLRTALPNVGIIVLTLMDAEGYQQAALEAGADEFVPKVTLNTDLLPTIRRLAQANRSKEQEARNTA